MKDSTDGHYNIFSARFWFGSIDLRPLGFARIAFGLALFWATIDLAPVLMTFFSDRGVAPRWALLERMARPNRVSVFDVAGPSWVLLAMFILTLGSIAAFTLGWHSRLASITTFVLVSGLHERDLSVLDSSDGVLRVVLFWMMFMPLGARYSVDAVRRAARELPAQTHASALPIRLGQVQVAWVYLDTTLYKWRAIEWHNGSALRIALGLDHLFTRPLGALLFHQRWFVVVGTHATLAIELLFLPLVFLPLTKPRAGALRDLPAFFFQPAWKARAIVAATALHLGIAGLMSVGNFSYVMISTFFLLYEPEWIEVIVRFLDARLPLRSAVTAVSVRLPFHLSGAFGPRLVATGRSDVVVEVLRASRSLATTVLHRLLLPLLLLLGMWFSLPEPTGIPALRIGGREYTPKVDISPSRMWPPLYRMIEEIELWQKWNMFAPRPLDHDVYIMGWGELADGTRVDVLRGARGNGGAIVPSILPRFFYSRWTKYVNNLVFEPVGSNLLLEFGRFICREWNTDLPRDRAPLQTFKLYREERRVPLFDESTPESWREQVIWDHRCF